MKFVCLTGCGKDSLHAALQAVSSGHELICIGTLRAHKSLYPTALSKCLSKPLVSSVLASRSFQQATADDLVGLLTLVKYRFPEVTAVVHGTVHSEEWRLRIEDSCSRVGLMPVAPLWGCDPDALILAQRELCIEAVVVEAESAGLAREFVGKSVSELEDYWREMKERMHIGRSGEYSSVVVDSPAFSHRLQLTDTDVVSGSCSRSVLTVRQVSIENKTTGEIEELAPTATVTPAVYVTMSHFETAGLSAESFGERECRSIEDEAFVVLKGAKELLVEKGVRLEDVYYVHVTLKSLSDFQQFNQVYKSFFHWAGPPARCCVETSSQRVRVQIALRGTTAKKTPLHVQSISSWAPANIGPYSQAIETQGKLHMAGAIGLVPDTMALAGEQMAQCLDNLQKVASVMGYDLVNAESAVVYYVGEQPDFPKHFYPFYMQVTRIPKDGSIEVELHLKKSLPPLKSIESRLDSPEFSATLSGKQCSLLLYATYHLKVESCSSPAQLLAALLSRLEEYHSSVQRRSPTLAGELLSTAPLQKSVLDYVTEVRIAVPEPHRYQCDWVMNAPCVFVASEANAVLVRVEDSLQLATYEFVQEERR